MFTFLIDYIEGTKDKQIWNIYYHLYLDDESDELLKSHLCKLRPLLGSIESWDSSPYGQCIRFCDRKTFTQIKKELNAYVLPNVSAKEDTSRTKHLQTAIQRAKSTKDTFTKGAVVFTGFRSAAPLSSAALKDLPKIHQHFWDCRSIDEDIGSLQKCKHPNPTFTSLVTDTLTLHYGTDPLLGFHLATAYAPLTAQSTLRLKSSKRSGSNRVVLAAQLEFCEWGKSFRRAVGNGLTIRYFTGDAIAFCCTLQHIGGNENSITARWYRSGYTFEQLELDGGDYAKSKESAPTTFDVIDTSNLIDHLGAIHTMIATAPLLASRASSTLYTEVLVQHEVDVGSMINNLLCGHYPTVSFVLGLTPVEYWTNATDIAIADEALFDALSSHLQGENDKTGRQIRSRNPWKVLTPRCMGKQQFRASTLFDSADLSRFLYEMYLSMFCNEDVTTMLSNIKIQTVQKMSNPYYHRASLAALICFLRDRVGSDWNEVMNAFLELVENDSRLMVGRNYMQELYLFLHMFGVHTVPIMSSDFRSIGQVAATEYLASWKQLPSVVCITMSVARRHLAKLTDMPGDKLGSPPICCTLQSFRSAPRGVWSNNFAVLQLGFGQAKPVGEKGSDTFRVVVEEDPSG